MKPFLHTLYNSKRGWVLAAGLVLSSLCLAFWPLGTDNRFLSFSVDSKTQTVKMFWKHNGELLNTFDAVERVEAGKNKTLLFAMNGGMFLRNYSPQGLYIENFVTLQPLDTGSGYGNFYMKPNGVFYLNSKGRGFICTTDEFKPGNDIAYATQSGPMLLVNGQIHPAFQPGSANLNIRNGVGVLPNGELLFVLSKTEVNFYDFAAYFLEQGCKQALYLDGYVSRAWCPQQQWQQTDGRFGVMIGVVKDNPKKF